jgi:hypothetical protein
MARDKHIWVPTSEGTVPLFLDADDARTVSGAWHAIGRYRRSHIPNDLGPVEGKTVAVEVEIEGKTEINNVEILSDPLLVDEFDEAGEFDVIDETIYVEKPK